MPQYAALLRGISPLNPNMRNEKLRRVFQELGFKNVRTVITSGNILFESRSNNKRVLENKIEQAIVKKLGFFSTTIIRSQLQLKRLVSKDPFNGEPDTPQSQHHVTFRKRGGEIFTKLDITDPKAGNVLLQIELRHGKEVTTRTWKTVNRIVDRFGKPVEKRKAK
jgi:uncharacterized protein (DUF1697 family)